MCILNDPPQGAASQQYDIVTFPDGEVPALYLSGQLTVFRNTALFREAWVIGCLRERGEPDESPTTGGTNRPSISSPTTGVSRTAQADHQFPHNGCLADGLFPHNGCLADGHHQFPHDGCLADGLFSEAHQIWDERLSIWFALLSGGEIRILVDFSRQISPRRWAAFPGRSRLEEAPQPARLLVGRWEEGTSPGVVRGRSTTTMTMTLHDVDPDQLPAVDVERATMALHEHQDVRNCYTWLGEGWSFGCLSMGDLPTDSPGSSRPWSLTHGLRYSISRSSGVVPRVSGYDVRYRRGVTIDFAFLHIHKWKERLRVAAESLLPLVDVEERGGAALDAVLAKNWSLTMRHEELRIDAVLSSEHAGDHDEELRIDAVSSEHLSSEALRGAVDTLGGSRSAAPLDPNTGASIRSSGAAVSRTAADADFPIPNIVHFVLTDRDARFFDWSCYAAVKAAWFHLRPERILIHVLDGVVPKTHSGWWRRLVDEGIVDGDVRTPSADGVVTTSSRTDRDKPVGVVVSFPRASIPISLNNVLVKHPAYIADFRRLQALYEYGAGANFAFVRCCARAISFSTSKILVALLNVCCRRVRAMICDVIISGVDRIL